MKILHKLLDIYLKSHVSRNPGRIKRIEELHRQPSRLLVISSTALGDTLLSTPAIKSLRKSFPAARITLLAHRNMVPLFAGFEYVDAVIPYHGGYKKFFATLQAIRNERPEAVLICHGNGPQDIAFAVLSGASYILKHPTNTPYKSYLSFDFPQQYQHTIEDRLDLVRKIGGTIIVPAMEIPPLDDAMKGLRVEQVLAGRGRLVGLQIGASHVYNMWPIENFIALTQNILAADPAINVVVTGIGREKLLGDRIAAACGARVLNCCGVFAIDELPYLLRRMELLVTGDTGPMHLAIALKVPTIALFSAADSRVTGAYQDPELHRIIQKNGGSVRKLPKKERDDSAMRLISVDEVFAVYEDIMHNRPV